MDTSANSSSRRAQIAAAETEERDALAMAKLLQEAGAPERDVKYALDRAKAAETKKWMLQQAAQAPQRDEP